jgi:hypothetical protein
MVFIYNGILFSHKKNEISLLAGKWMNLENITLSEASQVQKDKGCMFSLIVEDRSKSYIHMIHMCVYIYMMYIYICMFGRRKEEKYDRW